eukprot:gene28284-37211_t
MFSLFDTKQVFRGGNMRDEYVFSAIKTLAACNKLCVMLTQAALSKKAVSIDSLMQASMEAATISQKILSDICDPSGELSGGSGKELVDTTSKASLADQIQALSNVLSALAKDIRASNSTNNSIGYYDTDTLIAAAEALQPLNTNFNLLKEERLSEFELEIRNTIKQMVDDGDIVFRDDFPDSITIENNGVEDTDLDTHDDSNDQDIQSSIQRFENDNENSTDGSDDGMSDLDTHDENSSRDKDINLGNAPETSGSSESDNENVPKKWASSTDLNSWRSWGQRSDLYLDIQKQNAAKVIQKLSESRNRANTVKKYPFLSAMNKDFYGGEKASLKRKQEAMESKAMSQSIDDLLGLKVTIRSVDLPHLTLLSQV